MTMYRLSWEMVGQQHLHLYSNADPRWYSNTTQIVPNSEIPDEHWHKVSKEDEDPLDQYRTLKQWADEDREFVRHVVLERRIDEPCWEVVDTEPPVAPPLGMRPIKDQPQA